MSYYLLWPRRNRFAVNPVGAASDYIIAANARILLTLFGLAAAPVPGVPAVLSPTPVSDHEAETLFALPAAPVVTSKVYAKEPSAVTMTIANPCVVSYTAHGFPAGQEVLFTTTGALPTGVTASTTYYVISPAANTFQISATLGGPAIATTGTQNGVHTLWYRL